MTRATALLADDEPALARALAVRLQALWPELQVLHVARNGIEAAERIAALQPDLAFLDIQMPGLSGLEVAQGIEGRTRVVFVTAYDAYAVSAFDSAALDYLLKPVAPERLSQALQRLRERPRPGTRRPPPAQLLIPDRQRLQVVPVAEIRWLEAADNYVVVHAAGRAPLLRRTLAGLLQDLGPGFVQTHRSAAVALAAVRDVSALEGGEARVRLHDGSEVRCSRQRRAALLAHLGRG